MKNKILENKLLKKKKFSIIKTIEILEKDPTHSELLIQGKKLTGAITSSPIIDGMIIDYLDSLKVNIKFKESDENKISISNKIMKEKDIENCDSEIHGLRTIKKLGDRKKKAMTMRAKMFLLNKIIYVVCDKCHNFEKL